MNRDVFLIGSGRRIQNSFIPSFKCLQDKYTLVGLYSPTQANREAVCEKWNIPAFNSIASVDLSSIDVVVISISTQHVPAVLAQISDACRGKILIIDTPVFDSLGDFKAIRYLRNFSKVIVAEDYINYPQFVIMRDVLREGVLGDIRSITLAHTGFRYHALALVRSFVDFKKIRLLKRRHSDNDIGRITLDFVRGENATILEPYRRLDGWVRVEGSKASLIYDPGQQCKDEAISPTYTLNQYFSDEGDVYFSVEGVALTGIRQPRHFAQLKNFDIDDNSDFNTFKSCGLIDVIESIDSDAGASQYTWREALYDSALSKFIWRMQNIPRWKGFVLLLATHFTLSRPF